VARRHDGLAEPELARLCREKLAGFKQPKEFRFVELSELPRSSSGKIQRHELEKRLRQ
jgi:fatty-acyl-CoA synthase